MDARNGKIFNKNNKTKRVKRLSKAERFLNEQKGTKPSFLTLLRQIKKKNEETR